MFQDYSKNIEIVSPNQCLGLEVKFKGWTYHSSIDISNPPRFKTTSRTLVSPTGEEGEDFPAPEYFFDIMPNDLRFEFMAYMREIKKEILAEYCT